jgi:hypothetical protein
MHCLRSPPTTQWFQIRSMNLFTQYQLQVHSPFTLIGPSVLQRIVCFYAHEDPWHCLHKPAIRPMLSQFGPFHTYPPYSPKKLKGFQATKQRKTLVNFIPWNLLRWLTDVTWNGDKYITQQRILYTTKEYIMGVLSVPQFSLLKSWWTRFHKQCDGVVTYINTEVATLSHNPQMDIS